MTSAFKNRTGVFRNTNNNSHIEDSMASYKTRSILGRGDHDGAESLQSIHKVDPRFMMIQNNEPPPSPKSSMPSEVKVENWLSHNEKTQIDIPKPSVSAVDRQKQTPAAAKSTKVQPKRKPYFDNLKQLHSVQSTIRVNKVRSISASRATISNHEVSSTNEETPRRRKLTLREKLEKLRTLVPTSNCQTIDVHHDECSTNESCCLKRKCESKTKLGHSVHVMNLCCTNQKVIIIKPKIIPDPVLTEEEEELGDIEKRSKKLVDKGGNRLVRSRLIEEQLNLIRMKREIENFYMARGPSDMKPICKLMFPIIIFIVISLAMFSLYYQIGVFTRIYNTIEAWIGSSALVAMQRARPPTKWELWTKFVKKCVEKMTNSFGSFRQFTH